jgi:nitrite reductase/ring-hydroxylating ferredoxin subunit
MQQNNSDAIDSATESLIFCNSGGEITASNNSCPQLYFAVLLPTISSKTMSRKPLIGARSRFRSCQRLNMTCHYGKFRGVRVR